MAYKVISTTGPDAELFYGHTTDDDSDSTNGFRYAYTLARPLPAGQYTVNFHQQFGNQALCGFKPGIADKGYSTHVVTVTAPAGTLHEAFFDPVTVGTAVKADGSSGVLKPTSFTVGSTSTEITSLEWSSSQVVLTLGTHVSLGGQVLDFIDLNGKVALSLFADDATVDSTAGTYSWPMTSQPWADGDKLMLRIREGG